MRKAFDLETAALPLEEIVHLKPQFNAPSNWKDPAKIADNIAEQEKKWLTEAALNPLTGRILVVGIKEFGREPEYLEGNERDILQHLWDRIGYDAHYERWYGHAIHGFDLPFAVKRSWLHGIPVPMNTLFSDNGFINRRRFVDTMLAFQCGDRGSDYVGLDMVAKFFGMPGKTEDIGKDFGFIYGTDRPRALSYLARDLEIVEGVAVRMFPEAIAA